jgi:hypothetical protein
MLNIIRQNTSLRHNTQAYEVVVRTADGVSSAGSSLADSEDADRGAGDTNDSSDVLDDDVQKSEEAGDSRTPSLHNAK